MFEDKIIKRVTSVGIIGNIFLTAFKFVAGILGNSVAMISDAVHSLSDIIATLVAYIGTVISKRPADKEHPYGHERMECVAALLLGLILIIAGCGIGKSAIENIVSGAYNDFEIPKTIALVAAILSIVVKEAMYWYTRHYAKLIDSSVFMADAWHHRSDALSSVGSLIGIGLAMLGFPIADSIAGIIICLFIIKVAYGIMRDAIRKMMDTSVGKEYEDDIRTFVGDQEGVISVDKVLTRMFGNKIYIDLEIGVDGNLTLKEAHRIAERVHDELEKKDEKIKHVMVHVNPAVEDDIISEDGEVVEVNNKE